VARRGFTLIEVMIVILIVLALGGVVGYALLGTRDKAEQDIGRVQLDQFRSALKMFRVAHGRYPTDEEGLRVLWDKTALTDENDARNWTALMDQPLPNDRWGTPWGYRQKSEHGDETMYDLWSFGPDKQEGTSDDITSWDAKATPSDADGGGSEPAPTGS
jgi:general secretion pathway protein G